MSSRLFALPQAIIVVSVAVVVVVVVVVVDFLRRSNVEDPNPDHEDDNRCADNDNDSSKQRIAAPDGTAMRP